MSVRIIRRPPPRPPLKPRKAPPKAPPKTIKPNAQAAASRPVTPQGSIASRKHGAETSPSHAGPPSVWGADGFDHKRSHLANEEREGADAHGERKTKATDEAPVTQRFDWMRRSFDKDAQPATKDAQPATKDAQPATKDAASETPSQSWMSQAVDLAGAAGHWMRNTWHQMEAAQQVAAGKTGAIASIDATRVSDPAQAEALARRAQEVTKGLEHLGVNVVLVTPETRAAFLAERGIPEGSEVPGLCRNNEQVGLYLGKTNEVMLSTELLSRSPKGQHEVIDHEFQHAVQEKRLKDSGANGHSLPYMAELGAAFREAQSNEAGSKAAFENAYRSLGYGESESRLKAAHALENAAEFDACYSSLQKTCTPEQRKALAEAHPSMAAVKEREQSGTPRMTNREFIANQRDAQRRRALGAEHKLSSRRLDEANRSWVPEFVYYQQMAEAYGLHAQTRASGTASWMKDMKPHPSQHYGQKLGGAAPVASVSGAQAAPSKHYAISPAPGGAAFKAQPAAPSAGAGKAQPAAAAAPTHPPQAAPALKTAPATAGPASSGASPINTKSEATTSTTATASSVPTPMAANAKASSAPVSTASPVPAASTASPAAPASTASPAPAASTASPAVPLSTASPAPAASTASPAPAASTAAPAPAASVGTSAPSPAASTVSSPAASTVSSPASAPSAPSSGKTTPSSAVSAPSSSHSGASSSWDRPSQAPVQAARPTYAAPPPPPSVNPLTDSDAKAAEALAKAAEEAKRGEGQGRVSEKPVAEVTPPAPVPTQMAAMANVNEADLRALKGLLPQMVARGILNKADAAALEQFVKSGQAPDTEAGQALLKKALNTVGTLKDAGHDWVAESARVEGAVAPRAIRPSIETNAGRTIDDVVLKATSGSLNGGDFEFLAQSTGKPEGARNLADALEWMVSQPNGGQRMSDLFKQGAQAGNTTWLAQSLSNMSQSAPEQTLGLLLLTSDGAGGAASMVSFFGAMADKPQAAASFASLLDGLTRTPRSAASMAELLDVLTDAHTDDRSGVRTMARVFRDASAQSKGAASMHAAFNRTLEVEGGARTFARMLNRLSTRGEDTASFLQNLGANTSGREAVGRLLTRATASRDGARQVLESFTRMAGANGSEKKTTEVLARVLGSQSGAKFLAHLTQDAQTARGFETLLGRLDDSSREAGRRLGSAFQKAMALPEASALAQRAAESPALASLIDRFTPPVSEADAAPATVDVDLAGDPALALAVLDGARQTGAALRPDEKPAGERRFEPEAAQTLRTPEQQGAAYDRAVEATAETQARGSVNRVTAASKPEARKRSSVEDVDEATEAAAAPAPSNKRFRPSDVYSQSTLREARICGECGFRLTPGGRCVRCAAHDQREGAAIRRPLAVGAL